MVYIYIAHGAILTLTLYNHRHLDQVTTRFKRFPSMTVILSHINAWSWSLESKPISLSLSFSRSRRCDLSKTWCQMRHQKLQEAKDKSNFEPSISYYYPRFCIVCIKAYIYPGLEKFF